MFKSKPYIILSTLLLAASTVMAGTNTGRTCCCVGPAKRYHAQASLSKVYVDYVRQYTGTYDPYGNPVWHWVPVYSWQKYKTDTKHICYSNITAEVSDGFNVGGIYKDAKAHAERGPSINYQWSYSNNPQIHAGEDFSFMARTEIDFDQFNDGASHSELEYNDIKAEGDQLIIDDLNGYNVVSNTSIFESSLKIIVYQGVLENYIINDPDDPTHEELDFANLPVVYETDLHVTKDGVTGTGVLFDQVGAMGLQYSFLDYQSDPTTGWLQQIYLTGVKYDNLTVSIPLNSGLMDSDLGVLVITDDGISFNKLKDMYGLKDGSGNRVAQPITADYFSVSPNPSNGQILLGVQELQKGDYTLTVYDAIGRVVKTQNLPVEAQTSTEVNMDLGGLAKGNYYITLSGNGVKQTKKLILK